MPKKDACKRKRLMNIAIIDERNDAAATGEKIISITECVKQQQYRFSSDNETVGIITPTYAWGLPSIVRDFLYALVLDDTPVLSVVSRHIRNKRGTSWTFCQRNHAAQSPPHHFTCRTGNRFCDRENAKPVCRRLYAQQSTHSRSKAVLRAGIRRNA